MMVSREYDPNQIQNLEERLQINYSKLHAYETALDKLAPSSEEAIALRLRIKNELMSELSRLEAEYGTALANAVDPNDLPAEQADTLLAALDTEVKRLGENLPATASNDIRKRLDEINTQLDKPGRSAGAKLKVLLPIVPFLLVYELELDTENTLKDVWRSVKKLFRTGVLKTHVQHPQLK